MAAKAKDTDPAANPPGVETPAAPPVKDDEPDGSEPDRRVAEDLAAIKRQGLSAGNFSELKAAFVDLVELIQRMTGPDR